MKRLTFSCPDELYYKLEKVTGETEATAPNGLKVRLKLTRTDHIVNALWLYFAQHYSEKEREDARI